MPRPRKLIFNKSALFVTLSTEEGLVFPPNPLINFLLRSIMARAQELHPVRICHFLMESTHLHMLLVVENPDDVKGFMERFKTESAHAINRLLGRKKRTIWCAGYDSPVIGTSQDIIREIVYLYSNPVKDRLTQSLKDYPGLSTWKLYLNKQLTLRASRVYRSSIGKLRSAKLPIKEWRALTLSYERISPYPTQIDISPNAWMNCFGIPPEHHDAINAEIQKQVLASCDQHNAKRIREGKPIIGAKRLVLEAINAPFTPDRKGKRTWCICSDIPKRIAFIQFIKSMIAAAKEVLKKWRAGDYSVRFPLGLYPPSLPKHAELITALPHSW